MAAQVDHETKSNAMKYVVLGSINPKWADAPDERIRQVHAKLDQLQIAVDAVYYTQGEVDFVEILDVPTAEAMLALSLWYMTEGYGHLRSMPAFDMATVQAALAEAKR